ncbi:asparagine--tRNA ligase [Estrella lausannensis]|uniref:Asparagine--tRNA ligase n=1 Tax=Estrella lausannensis TaxID=483423 RepID=A0A0H5DQF6_9BACT|nr:asparagine--tRNA ligase [Estrella lausannensis]CRX37789.1 Asparaginyl-tRNA synthetase [Estrella lausannensis]
MRIKIKQLKSSDAANRFLGKEITIKGWVRTLREQKAFSFIEVNDGSTLTNFQVIADSNIDEYERTIRRLGTGASLAATGTIVENPDKKGVLEMHATAIEVIGTCDQESYPLQKKRHSFEFLRSIAHLRPRTNSIGAVARVRNALAFATHLFFQERGFCYVHTPIITASDCEGAGQMFQVTTLDMDAPAKTPDGKVDYASDFFKKPAYLTVSGQLEGEIYATALSDIYTFGPTFRAENSNTARHLAEFWMIEPEMAFADITDNMDNVEAYLKYVLKYVVDNCREDMYFFNKYISPGVMEQIEQVINTPFERTSYTFAVRILEKSGENFEFPIKWGMDLQSEHERYLVEKYFQKPVIITDYPKDIKAFYMRENDDGKTVAAMDVLVPRIGEIVGGSQREERLDVLEEKLDRMGLPKESYWWYLELRKYGTVPHAGYGVGFERLIRFVTGMENIRDVIPFPRFPGYADF